MIRVLPKFKDGQPSRLLFPVTDLSKVPVAFDLETYLMNAQNGPLPRPVCASFAQGELSNVTTFIEGAVDVLRTLLEDENYLIIGHNVSFDFGVLSRHCPELNPLILRAHNQGRVADTLIAQKLIDLQTTGFMSEGFLRGTPVRRQYNLATLLLRHSLADMTEMKSGPDSWRLRYDELDGFALSEWPQAAIDYPLADAENTLKLWHRLVSDAEVIADKMGHHPFTSLSYQCAKAFALRLTGAEGITVDIEERERVRDRVMEQHTTATSKLIDRGIISPAEPERPYANKCKNPDGTPKMKAAVPPKTNTKALREAVKDALESLGLPVKTTEAADKVPEDQRGDIKFVATSSEVLMDIPEGYDEIIDLWRERQEVAKIVTTELPRISPDLAPDYDGEWQGEVWTDYDPLKETGRSSARGSDLFPSLNSQNIAASMRKCFRAKEGEILLSHDYRSMELVSAGQRYLDTVGFSVTADKINEGTDLHAYLGAEIAYKTWQPIKHVPPANLHQAFKELANVKSEIEGKTGSQWWKHFRTFAKPTGLGYPGGLSGRKRKDDKPTTFQTYAKTTYKVEVDADTSELLQDIWASVYPEIPQYFEWMQARNVDRTHSYEKDIAGPFPTRREAKEWMDANPSGWAKITEKPSQDGYFVTKKNETYFYVSPNGMWRAACDYCSAMNGSALQTPSSEGAHYALYRVWEEVLMGRLESYRPNVMVHDEIIGKCPDNREIITKTSEKLDKIMCEAFSRVIPHVKSATEAGPMRTWSKDAKPVYDSEGLLMVWEDHLNEISGKEVEV